MFSTSFRVGLAFTLLFSLVVSAVAQSRVPRQTPAKKTTQQTPPQTPDSAPSEPNKSDEVETLKTETDLVTVPVIATDRTGIYITDLKKEDFGIEEDGVKQEVAFFGTVAKPFQVVLLLDTSASTRENLGQIQQAAYSFVQQLQPADRVKIISFDEQIRDLNEFTSNRETLRLAINSTRSGEGTKVYDAMEVALDTVRNLKGRKAIVIFSDAVDWHSDRATFASTVRWLDEEGVIVYPIRYDTRDATERLARESVSGGPVLPTREVVNRPPAGTTAPTFPGGDPIPTSGSNKPTGPFGLPSADEILRRKRESDRDRDQRRVPSEGGRAPSSDPGEEPVRKDTTRPVGVPGSTTSTEPPPPGTIRRRPRPDDSITTTLDMAYETADLYLKTLADKTGGRLLRADSLKSLPDAFAKIAAELRTQYLLGYYPINKGRDYKYRKIRVSTTRQDVVVRARPGYLATEAR
jgi:Mg-chelatase subunit ChlD